jgi:hypothetical protein
MSDITDRGPLVDADDIGLPPVEGLDLPQVETRTFALTDDDAGECRTIDEVELAASYVDNNIVAIEPLQPDPWTLDPASIDNQDLQVTYASGARFATKLGSINMNSGPTRYDLRKSGGLIFPVDSSGNPLFDATNTPRLAAIRWSFLEQLRQRSEERLEIAEIVNAFAGAISSLGNTADLKF